MKGHRRNLDTLIGHIKHGHETVDYPMGDQPGQAGHFMAWIEAGHVRWDDWFFEEPKASVNNLVTFYLRDRDAVVARYEEYCS